MFKPLTKDGEDWMVLALDPFHDTERNIEGLPDSLTGMSFVRKHVQTAAFDSPGANGTIRIGFTGFHSNNYFQVGRLDLLSDPDAAEVNGGYPNLQVKPIYVISGTTHPPSIHECFEGHSVMEGGFPTCTDGSIPCRLIAIGIEVHDVTAKLYQQGTVGVARIPGGYHECDVPIHLVNEEAEPGPLYDWMGFLSTHTCPAIPNAHSELSALPTYVEWEAAKGVYAIPNYQHSVPPACFRVGSVGIPGSFQFHPVELREVGDGSVQWRFVSQGDDLSTAELYTKCTSAVQSGFEPIAIDFTGLSDESTLRVTVRTIVEYFPEASSLVTLSGATPSCSFDPMALHLYHQVASTMPSGVPVDMNPKGEYWNMVKEGIKSVFKFGAAVAPPLASAYGMPGLGNAIALTSAAANAINRPKRPKKKKGKSRPSR